ncbi:MAG: DNA mismatch repair protein MutS [Spirochaetaceae bacterium]|jgi:DNA mismatch repair protein MutS|nr:DNA mismatch repair protein MutS [Spirochaetaceae bacterium]
MKDKGADSPMLAQYRRIKKEHQGDVLFFRLGDFYEMFADDALEISALLNLTLTHRNGLPMCGVPYHAARSYIARLLKYGKKIAICEQVGEPAKGKTLLIERDVVEVISPGTTVDEEFLERGSANYLACIFGAENSLAFAYIDLSTGEFRAAAFPLDDSVSRLRQELERLDIKEIVVEEALLRERPLIARALDERRGIVVNRWADWFFDAERSAERLHRQFGHDFAKELGRLRLAPELLAAGALLSYLDEAAKSRIPHVRRLVLYDEDEYVWIDEASRRNLELIRNLRDGDQHFSLLETLDETKTAMGRRLLKHRVSHPLRDIAKIEKRLEIVDIFYHDQKTLSALRGLLAGMPDFQRLSSRIAMNRAHGKDMLALKNALSLLEKCCLMLDEAQKTGNWTHNEPQFESEEAVSFNGEAFSRLLALKDTLERGICDDPSTLLTEGKLIRAGFNAELDALHELRDNGRALLEAYLEEERGKTGITNLKIRYNRLLGYHFEVAVNQLARVPHYFIKRQGLVSGERFTTERLAALESEINGASDRVVELEKTLFFALREEAKGLLPEIAAAARIAELDTAQSLARAAAARVWARPLVNGLLRLNITEGRHPVVEANLARGEFIPNDVVLDARPEGGTAPAFALITGPNMAGKSTYLRQAALITIMAQMGSFVPARVAEIGVADRIYCRVGASDNLARGESTFLSEMLETAAILNSATERSLVIMDEVGRGTGTRDGLAIARAVSEYLLDTVRCRALFATHYHELAALRHPRLANRSLLVEEIDGEIVFRRRLVEGAAAESYGLHVASLAGIPDEVLRRAEELMLSLKSGERAPPPSASFTPARPEAAARKASETLVAGELAKLDPDATSPLEALHLICRWKALLDGAPSRAARKKPPSPATPIAPAPSQEAAPPQPGLFDE